MKRILLSATAVLAIASFDAAQAAEVTLIGPGGIRAAITQMIPGFEKASGVARRKPGALLIWVIGSHPFCSSHAPGRRCTRPGSPELRTQGAGSCQ